MVDYPMEFGAESETEEGKWRLETEEGLEIDMTVPEDFGGDPEHPSPEDLYNASLNTCVLATFRVTAERKGLEYSNIKVESETSLDRNEEGRPVMNKAEIQVKIEGAGDRDLAKEVEKMTRKNCFIHNSVKTETELDFSFEPE